MLPTPRPLISIHYWVREIKQSRAVLVGRPGLNSAELSTTIVGLDQQLCGLVTLIHPHLLSQNKACHRAIYTTEQKQQNTFYEDKN